MTSLVDAIPDPSVHYDEFDDVSQVEKFEISPEEYAKRNDTILAFKMRNKLGRFDDSIKANKAAPKPIDEAELIAKYPLGSRCEITSLSTESPLRGTLRFVGRVDFNEKQPFWIGVELDEPRGKNDGAVDGKRYFQCPPLRGIFLQPERVTIGNFPPLDPLEDEEI
ncbi:hypothetical protein O181_082465 [Austropuccinia psidii MF-1]|uniref:CAP-Gly domain-containing protein n=1 Tax=Austropuccinia psidii MF-1 TaxID=1389203 RepID=A0A9Q3FRX2_9BASI|nr:hypothetical protein [Austropuccinia psidii MF-1]